MRDAEGVSALSVSSFLPAESWQILFTSSPPHNSHLPRLLSRMRTTSASQSHSIVPSPTPTIAPSPEPQLELTTKGKPKLTLGNDEPASAKPVEREDLSPRAPSPPEGKDSKNTGTAVQESKHEAALADQTNLLPTRQVGRARFPCCWPDIEARASVIRCVALVWLSSS